MRIHSGYIYFIPFTSFIIHGDFIYDHLWSFVAILRFSMFQKLISDLFRSQNSNSDSDTHSYKYKCFRNSKVQKRIRTVRVGHEPSHGFRLGHWYVRKPGPNSVKLTRVKLTLTRVYLPMSVSMSIKLRFIH